jgi:hypothetical protein
MNTLEHLQRVLPSEGFYVTTVINPDGNRQGFFSTVDELAKAVAGLDQTGNNTYFAISAFKEKGSRKQDNVRAIKVVALDVDCGNNKPYPSWKEGLVALGTFIQTMNLPKPMIVFSGNGLHVYWCLTEELEPARWKPIAEAMKSAAIANEFHIDAGLTANSALVLRPIGTHNPKNGNEVKLLVDAEPVSHELLKSCLVSHLAHEVSLPRNTTGSKLLQDMAVKTEFPPTIGAVVAKKCQQIKWAVENQGEVKEPQWYCLLGVAAFCVEPEATAIEWSQNHPKFDAQRTLQKLIQWKDNTDGPTRCDTWDINRPGGCKGCKFKDKIKSPAALGLQYQQIAPPQDALDKAAFDVPMPRGFKRTADGIKMTIDETDIDVCSFDIYPVGYGRDEGLGYETVRYHWNRQHKGWQELALRQAHLTDGHREFASTIADQGIVLNNKRQTEYFQLMLRSYMDELRQKRAMTNLYATMGWKENFSQFVIGDTLLRREPDGSVSEENISLSAGTQRLGNELYGVSGDAQQWADFTSVLEKTGLHWHMFALGVGLSAPLYAFTGLKGLTVSLFGPSGGGKSLIQMWVQSIYGDPDKLHFAAKFTQNTLFGRMGIYSHMPMTIDEVTLMVDKEVGDFAYWVSQGRDKARLNRNAEERDAKTWAMPVLVSTNKSLQSKLVASGLETDAQMARLLEIDIPLHELFTRDSTGGRKIHQFIHTNYGHAGRLFVKKLLELGADGVRAAIDHATADFHKKYKANFVGQERYWEQAIILSDLASRLCVEWGIIKYDYTLGTEWVLKQLGAIRRSVVENKMDAFDLFSNYLNDSAGAAVTVMHTGTDKGIVDYSRMPRADIRVRFDTYRRTAADKFDKGVVLVDRTHFRRWLAQNGGDYKSFMQQMQFENVVATPKSEKAFLGKDTPIKLGQAYVLGLNLNHPKLVGILSDADELAADLTLGQMRVA